MNCGVIDDDRTALPLTLTPYAFTVQNFWAGGNPSGAGDCVAMSLPSGRWVDMSCDTALPYVCEIPLFGSSNIQVRAYIAHTLLSVFDKQPGGNPAYCAQDYLSVGPRRARSWCVTLTIPLHSYSPPSIALPCQLCDIVWYLAAPAGCRRIGRHHATGPVPLAAGDPALHLGPRLTPAAVLCRSPH